MRVSDQSLEGTEVLVDIDLGDRITLPSLGVEYRVDLVAMTSKVEVRCVSRNMRKLKIGTVGVVPRADGCECPLADGL